MANTQIVDLESTVFEIIILVYLLFGRAEGIDRKVKRNILILFGVLVTSVYTMTLLQLSILVKSMGVILLTAVLSKKLNGKSIKFGIAMGTLFIMAVSISDIITMGILHLFIKSNQYINHTPYFYILTVSLSKLLLMIFILLTKKFLDKGFRKINFGNWIVIIIPNLFNLLLLLMIGYRMYYHGSVVGAEAVLLLFIALMLLISTFCNITTSEYYYEMKEIEHNSKMNMAQLQLQYEYYKTLQEDQLKVRELYHDMKNHLLILQNNLETEQKEKYIKNMLLDMNGYENYIDTGNDFLNCIMNQKHNEAISKGIDFHVMIDFSDINFMNPMDICTIFSNAIDNAIEACDKMDCTEQKVVSIKARKVKNFLSITFENSSKNDVTLDDQTIETTKPDKNLHGFGLNNIKKAVEKYQGEYRIKIDMHQFKLFLVIPIVPS